MKRFITVGLLTFSLNIILIQLAAGTTIRQKYTDTPLTNEIKKQLSNNMLRLYYPKLVKRFYEQTNNNPTWIKPQNQAGATWQAMLMLDCVLAFGLSHDDYHPIELTYQTLHNILDTPGRVKVSEQATYEIMLTDAIITLMNHLHYGKLNPDYTASVIDAGMPGKFQADVFLTDALKQKELMTAIADAQPKMKLYTDLQRRMLLLKGKYQDDCYEVPEAEVRKIAANMERLRWAAINSDNYLLINIPTYTLTYQQRDTAYEFKIAVGKPESPTPVLKSAVTFFATAPDAKVAQDVFVNTVLPNSLKDIAYLKNHHYAIYNRSGHFVVPTRSTINEIANNPDEYYARHSSGLDIAHGNLVFSFPNPYQVYLHDMPKKDFFNKRERAFSGGCVWLADAEKLGELLLTNDGAAKDIAALSKAFTKYQRKTFVLKTPVPIHIIYITCGINDYGTVVYKDVYNLDPGLEMSLYNIKQPLTVRVKQNKL